MVFLSFRGYGPCGRLVLREAKAIRIDMRVNHGFLFSQGIRCNRFLSLLLPLRLLLGAVRLHRRLGVIGLAVLAVEVEGGAEGALADVGRVLKEALLGSLQGDDRLLEGSVGDGFDPGAKASLDRVDAAVEVLPPGIPSA